VEPLWKSMRFTTGTWSRWSRRRKVIDRVTHRAARSCPAQRATNGAVDNPISAKPHLTNTNFCPNKRATSDVSMSHTVFPS
jgi:hypothetical protein